MPMKRSLQAVLTAIVLAGTAHAQRAGNRGTSAPHHSTPVQTSSAPVTASRPAPQGYAYRASAIAPPARPQDPYSTYSSPGASAIRPAFYHGNRGGPHSPVRRGHRLYTGYGYPDYIGVHYLDFNGPYLDDESTAEVPAPEAYDQPNPNPGPYLDQPQPAPTQAGSVSPPPLAAEAITLVFKDGHTQQIHNFIVTRSSISVIQGQRHFDIAVADLDMSATQKANRAAGVDFALPGPAQ
jgi:hypothetical protein